MSYSYRSPIYDTVDEQPAEAILSAVRGNIQLGPGSTLGDALNPRPIADELETVLNG